MMCQNICIPAVHEMQWLWPYHNPSSQMHLQGLSERKGKKKRKKKLNLFGIHHVVRMLNSDTAKNFDWNNRTRDDEMEIT